MVRLLYFQNVHLLSLALMNAWERLVAFLEFRLSARVGPKSKCVNSLRHHRFATWFHFCHRAFLTLHTAREAIQVCHPRFSGYDTFGPRGSLVKGHIQLVSLTFLLLFLLRKYRCFLSNDSKTVTAQHASTIRKNMQNE